jgi:hypothetical protein
MSIFYELRLVPGRSVGICEVLLTFPQITFPELYSAQLARPVHQALSQNESMKQQDL